MKKIQIIILAVLLLPFVSFSQQDTLNRVDKQGRKQGLWIKYEKGKKVYEGRFKDDNEVGVFIHYHKNGQEKARNYFYEKGKCKSRMFTTEGLLMCDGFYHLQKRDSIWLLYGSNGKVVEKQQYKFGSRVGCWEKYSTQGDTLDSKHYVDNKLEGMRIRKFYYSFFISNYKNDKLHGPYEEYDYNHKLLMKGQYENGEKTGKWHYFNEEDHRLEKTEIYVRHQMTDRIVYFKTSQGDIPLSIHEIAYFFPKGTTTLITQTDGSTLSVNHDVDAVFDLVGMENFVSLNIKSRFIGNKNSIKGLGKDSEGFDIVLLNPKPAQPLYPDEDCIKMIKSMFRKDFDK